jgi:hypothetical protein
MTAGLPVHVEVFDGLIVDCAKKHSGTRQGVLARAGPRACIDDDDDCLPYVPDTAAAVDFLVRGLRAYSDFEYEFRMALVNRKLIGIETSFLMADEKHSHISSSLIRELAHFGKTLPEFVPVAIQNEVYSKLGVPYDGPLSLQ